MSTYPQRRTNHKPAARQRPQARAPQASPTGRSPWRSRQAARGRPRSPQPQGRTSAPQTKTQRSAGMRSGPGPRQGRYVFQRPRTPGPPVYPWLFRGYDVPPVPWLFRPDAWPQPRPSAAGPAPTPANEPKASAAASAPAEADAPEPAADGGGSSPPDADPGTAPSEAPADSGQVGAAELESGGWTRRAAFGPRERERKDQPKRWQFDV